MGAKKAYQDWHVVDFFFDDRDCCALTVVVHNTWFHVIADVEKLGDNSSIMKTYLLLLRKIQCRQEGGVAGDEPSVEVDSGVDVSEGKVQQQQSLPENKEVEPELALQTWMLEPMSATFDHLTPKDSKQLTLQQWYHCPKRFYRLSTSRTSKDLKAEELEETSELVKRVESLIPQVTLAKKTSADLTSIPTYTASDVTVLEESDQPTGTPYHPCRVKVLNEKETYFLKVVDKNQPQATKRELLILNRIKELRLEEHVHVPILMGLVVFDKVSNTATGRKRIMGFLQTEIPNPKPLTVMLDPSVPPKKREKWAEEAEYLKETLHRHGIVWGDAKADNFMVDKDDELWIIDFGGSYTPGWVDEEMKETLAGDDLGTEKTANALRDPVNNVMDSGGEELGDESQKYRNKPRAKKRLANEEDKTKGEQQQKRAKT